MSDDRPNAILTAKQRAFLNKSDEEREEDYSRQARDYHKNAIKTRVWNSFLDGQILFNNLSDEQRQEIFEAWDEFAERAEVTEEEKQNRPDHFPDLAETRGQFFERVAAERGFAGWLAFLYLGIDESDQFDLRSLLELALERAEQSRDRELEELTFHVDARRRLSIEELVAKFETRKELTTSQLNRLRDAGEISDEDLVAYYDDYREHSPDGV